MADIMINFSSIQQAAEDFQSAAGAMVQALEDAMNAVNSARTQLSGSLQSEAQAIYDVMNSNSSQMNSDLTQAAITLDKMAGLLQDADKLAANGFTL